MRRTLAPLTLLAALLAAPAHAAPAAPVPEASAPAAPTEPVPEASAPAAPTEPVPEASQPAAPTEPVPADSKPSSAGGAFTSDRDPAVSATLPKNGAAAELPLPARHRLVYSNLLVMRVNPLGLEDRFVLGYQLRLYNKTGKLFRDAYLGVAFSPTFSPSITRIGAQIDLAPLTILRFRAGYYLSSWYGSAKFKAHPFASPYADYSPDTLDARADAKQSITTFGGQAELGALFQIKAGPVAVRNELIAYHNNIRMTNDAGGKPYDVFYDLRHDVLVPARGWWLTNDSDLLFVTKFGLAAGVRNSLVHVFYPAAVFEPGDDAAGNPNTPMDRFGPILSHTFYDRPERRFNKPTLFFSAQWWLLHRYRAQGTSGPVNQAIPLFLLGFAFSGELVRSKH